ncbi:tetratricopeptide repeat protein, partial [Acinetobacter baumannii]
LLQSQIIVAGLLYNGEGVTKDHKKAFEWALKAANQGDVESQNNIGLAYENGDGVAKDPVLAKEWFEKAANNGFVLGQYNLALKYLDGNGVEQ